MRNDPLDPLTVIGVFTFIEMMVFLMFFTDIVISEPFVGDFSSPEILSISLILIKMIQMGVVAWADLDRDDTSTHKKNLYFYISISILELILISYAAVTYFIQLSKGTLRNSGDAEFARERKI